MAALRLYILSNWHLVAIINNAALGVPVVTAAKHGPCYREISKVLRLPSAIQVRASESGARSSKQSLLVSGSVVHVFSRFVTQTGGCGKGGGGGGRRGVPLPHSYFLIWQREIRVSSPSPALCLPPVWECDSEHLVFSLYLKPRSIRHRGSHTGRRLVLIGAEVCQTKASPGEGGGGPERSGVSYNSHFFLNLQRGKFVWRGALRSPLKLLARRNVLHGFGRGPFWRRSPWTVGYAPPAQI